MTFLDTNGKYLFPKQAYNSNNYAVVCVNTAFIPFFRIFFATMQERWRWSTREDWWRSYQVFAEMEEMLMIDCMKQVIASQDRIYRLLDTALNGTTYVINPPVAPATEPTITPPIHIAPPNNSPHYPSRNAEPYGLRMRLERLINLIDNQVTGRQTGAGFPELSNSPLTDTKGLREALREMQGTINAGWFGIGGENATIADVVEALRIGSGTDNDIIDDALDALGAAANVASIFAVVKDLLRQGVQTGIEGGTLAVLLVSTLANATAQQMMAQQLDRIIAALDGGAMLPPDDNVLGTLRNINQNVDEVEALLR